MTHTRCNLEKIEHHVAQEAARGDITLITEAYVAALLDEVRELRNARRVHTAADTYVLAHA